MLHTKTYMIKITLNIWTCCSAFKILSTGILSCFVFLETRPFSIPMATFRCSWRMCTLSAAGMFVSAKRTSILRLKIDLFPICAEGEYDDDNEDDLGLLRSRVGGRGVRDNSTGITGFHLRLLNDGLMREAARSYCPGPTSNNVARIKARIVFYVAMNAHLLYLIPR